MAELLQNPLFWMCVAVGAAECLLVGLLRPSVLLLGSILAARLLYELILLAGIEIPGAIASQSALRVSALVAGFFVLALWTLLLTRQKLYKLPAGTWYLPAFFVAWNLVATVNGLLRGNDLVYLIGDTYNTLQVYLVTVCCYSLLCEDRQMVIRLWLFYLVLFLAIDTLYLVRYGTMILLRDYHRIGGGNYLSTTLAVALLVAGIGGRVRRLITWSLVFSVAVLIAAAYRGKWLLLIMASLLVLFIYGDRRLWLRRGVPIVATIAVVLSGLLYVTRDTLVPYLERRVLEETIERYRRGDLDTSNQEKMYEVRRVIEEVGDDVVGSIFGFGSGAEFGLTRGAVVYIEEKYKHRGSIHNIHNTYFAVLFRYGAAGLFLFCGSWYAVLRKGWVAIENYLKMRSRRRAFTIEHNLTGAILVCAVVYIVTGLLGFTQDFYIGVYLGNIEWGLLVGTVLYGFRVYGREMTVAKEEWRRVRGTDRGTESQNITAAGAAAG